MLKYWIWCRILHILIDVTLVFASFLLAYFLRVGWIISSDFPLTFYALSSVVGAALWVGFLVFTKYYRIPPRSGSRVSYDLTLVLVGGIIANGFLIVTYFFPREILFSRLISVYAFTIGVLLLFLTQFIFRQLLKHFKRQNIQTYKTLIIGANRVSEKLITAINTNPYAPYQIAGVIDPYGLEKSIKGSRILGKLDKLDDVCASEGINCIIQCDAFEHTINLISFCEEKNIKYQFDPALRGVYEENLRIREVAGQTMISFVKRDFDSSQKKKQYKYFDWGLRQFFDVD